jgi:hypothetical protein
LCTPRTPRTVITMRSRSFRIAIVAVGLAVTWGSPSPGQTNIPVPKDKDSSSGQPKQPGTPQKPPQETPKPRPVPQKPAPTPKEKCRRDGGEWDSGECVTREKCERERKGEWVSETQTCRCPTGKQRYGTVCVEVPPPPVESPEQAKKRACEQQGGVWTGTECDTRKGDCESDGKGRWDPEKSECISPPAPPGPSAGLPPAVAPPTAAPPPAPPPAVSPALPVPTQDRSSASAWRTASLLVGGALVATGTVAGIVALGKKDSWSSQCDANKQCPASAKDDWEVGNTAANVSTWTLAIGIPLTLVGVAWPLFSRDGGRSAASAPTVTLGVARTATTIETAWRF